MVFVALTYGLRFSKLVFPCTAPSVSICVSIIVLNCKRLREKKSSKYLEYCGNISIFAETIINLKQIKRL